MKIISKTFKILPLLLVVFAFQACSNDDDNNTIVQPQQLDIVDTAIATPELSSLVAAVQAAGLEDVLRGNGPFTVLAPTNDAFDAFLNGTPLSQVDPAVLQQILLNHVISADVSAADLVSLSGADGKGYTRTNANGAGGENISILFDTSGALPRFNNTASVVSAAFADVTASNGTVHVIDAVLGLPDIVDHALNNDNFTSLTGALSSENLVTVLQGTGPFTVFAPTNDAFAAFTNPNGNALSDILLNHVLPTGPAFAASLSTSYRSTAATNADSDNLSMFINVGENVVINGTSTVVATDIVGTNGVIHVVDNVIDLPTIATFATSNTAALSSLVSALALADTGSPTVPWINTVSDTSAGPFTVFAPTNAAFEALLLELDPSGNTALGDIDPATVDAVLLMHVANGNVRAEDLPMLMGSVPVLSGETLDLDVNTLTLTDGLMRDIGIIAELTNIQAVNGVVHVVDTVIRPTP